MILDELLVALGFEYDPKDIAKFRKDLTQTVNIVKKLTSVAVGAAATITGLTVASTKASDEQGKFAAEIGDSVENIDALQFALERSGGSANAMVDSLRNLAMRSAEAARGVGSGVEAFGILGISVTSSNGELKRSSDLMLEVSDRLQGLDRSRQIELADKLGLTGSIRLLQHGSKEIINLTSEAKALGVTTAEDAKISAQFQDSLTNIFTVVKDLSRTVAREFAPRIKDLADAFSTWWIANSELIKQGLPGWIDKATVAIKLLAIATGAWLAMRLATGVILVAKAFKTLSLSAMLANLAVLGIPGLIVLAIGTAVTAVGLLIDDMRTFFKGGESYVGDLVKKIPMIGEVLYAIANAVKYVKDKFIRDWQEIKEFFSGVISSVKDEINNIFVFLKSGQVLSTFKILLSNLAKYLKDTFLNSLKIVFDFFEGLWDAVYSSFKIKVLKPISTALNNLTKPISTALNKAANIGSKALSQAKSFLGFDNVFDPKALSQAKQDLGFDNVTNPKALSQAKSFLGFDNVFDPKVKKFLESTVKQGNISTSTVKQGDISTSTVRNNITKVDKLEISVPGTGDPSAVANAVYNIFQQTSQDLNTAVEQ